MEARPFTPESDYRDVACWWEAHKWPSVPLEMLPRTGIIIEDSGQKLAAGWLYRTDSAIAWLEFVIGNPESDKILRGQALDLLIDTLLAEASGFKVVFTSVNHPKLIERYESRGFVITDRAMSNMVRRLV